MLQAKGRTTDPKPAPCSRSVYHCYSSRIHRAVSHFFVVKNGNDPPDLSLAAAAFVNEPNGAVIADACVNDRGTRVDGRPGARDVQVQVTGGVQRRDPRRRANREAGRVQHVGCHLAVPTKKPPSGTSHEKKTHVKVPEACGSNQKVPSYRRHAWVYEHEQRESAPSSQDQGHQVRAGVAFLSRVRDGCIQEYTRLVHVDGAFDGCCVSTGWTVAVRAQANFDAPVIQRVVVPKGNGRRRSAFRRTRIEGAEWFPIQFMHFTS